jgi:pyridoxal phosphate enzyme (YggS family)
LFSARLKWRAENESERHPKPHHESRSRCRPRGGVGHLDRRQQGSEAAGKWPGFREDFDGIDLHIIGPLQSNKVRQAMELAEAIHTVDRPKLAKTIARLAQEMGRCPDLFIQVNTGEEDQKAGVMPREADDFIAECRALDLPIKGLMCIPPVDEAPSLHFALLAKVAARNDLSGLSMGMSGDFEQAIALGATHVRVGSAIFGERVSE